MSRLEEAKRFREVFGQEMLDNISRYGFIKKKLWTMQCALIEEEAKEFLNAADEVFADPENDKRREELLKELADLVFVCYQFAAAYKLDLDEALRLVFESNMSKLDEQGNVIYRADGKVLKGPNYQPPDFRALSSSKHSLRYTWKIMLLLAQVAFNLGLMTPIVACLSAALLLCQKTQWRDPMVSKHRGDLSSHALRLEQALPCTSLTSVAEEQIMAKGLLPLVLSRSGKSILV